MNETQRSEVGLGFGILYFILLVSEFLEHSSYSSPIVDDLSPSICHLSLSS